MIAHRFQTLILTLQSKSHTSGNNPKIALNLNILPRNRRKPDAMKLNFHADLVFHPTQIKPTANDQITAWKTSFQICPNVPRAKGINPTAITANDNFLFEGGIANERRKNPPQ